MWNISFDIFGDMTMDEWEKEMAIIPRHADLGDTALNDLEKRCFEGWLAENKKVVDFKTVTKEEFNIPLRQFYGNVGNGKGEKYSRSSYLVLQSGLNRFLNDPPIGRSWCLMKDTEFTILNHVFMGNIKQLRRQGKDITNSHPPISNKEMAHLQNSQALNPGTPRGLVQKVWFHLQLHLGRRGKEGNRQLKPNSFLIKTDKNGLRYATLAYNEATKNHLDPRERGRESKTGFMFEQPGNPLCPVASLEKYQSKCPENALAFYLHSRRGECIGDSIWYTLEPMGVNYLAALLPKICRATGSTTYTNHSIRTTTVQKLANADLEAREIMSVSGHWCKASRHSYWRPLLTDRKRWSNILAKNKENTAAASTPKRLKQGSRSSSTDSDRYFNQCTIQGNVQINVTYNK
ncbi:uncharacterized protein LOC121546074 [Coregonus clupeaformis]|uniref:uncharacterized protein LOC121546074 n=1 Tax=Coregonus clupeaformis TaxID=59861 RepID=UPI001BE07E5C|nr:uncharacterized protein LOC121546074 [Coregonus clupeaformis]